MKKILLSVGALIVVLGVIVFARMAGLPKNVAAAVDNTLLLEVDADAAAAHLSDAIRFKTVTMQNSEDTDWAVFTAFQTWLAETYPNFYGAA